MAQQLAHDDQGNLLIDIRGPRFGAAITTAVLASALIVGGGAFKVLVVWQTIAFAISSLFGLAYSPYGNLFRWAKHRFDLGPPPETELEGPPRFAQTCGLVCLGVADIGLLAGSETTAIVFTAIVLALSTLLATTGICVGCELYLIGQRLKARSA